MNIEILIFQALKNIEGECTQAFNCRLVKMLEMNMPNLLGDKRNLLLNLLKDTANFHLILKNSLFLNFTLGIEVMPKVQLQGQI